MIQRLTHIICMMAGILTCASCYDDNGNYSYTDIGQIDFDITIDTTVMYKNKLEMEPRNITCEGSSETDYDWSWELASDVSTTVPTYKEIGSERKLSIPSLEENTGNYYLRLSAIHKESGVRTMRYCMLTIDNGLSRVYLLLSRQADGNYDIDAVTHPEGVIRKNQYSLRNERTIADAERLFYVNSSYSYDERLYLTQASGGQSISPIDLSYQGEATDWFFEVPDRIHVTGWYHDASARDQFMINNGGIYYLNNVNSPLKASLREVPIDNTDYNITGTGAMINSSGTGQYAFYDELNGRFLQWNASYGTYYIYALSTTPDIAATAFDPQQINKKLRHVIEGKEDRLWFIFEDDGGDWWLYTFKDASTAYYNVAITPNEAPCKLDAATQAAFKQATAFEAVKTVNKFYYAVGNTIYLYNADTKRTEETPFYVSPNADMRFSKIYYRDKDEQEVTFAGNDGEDGYFYRALVDYQGRMAQPTEEEKEPFKTYEGFGQITDFTYKYKAY